MTSTIRQKLAVRVFDDIRINVWAKQPAAFFEWATLDMDGTLVATTGECKRGMDSAYDGTWGYHPLVLSLTITHEVLSGVNRSGKRPFHEGTAEQVDKALDVCFRGGFRRELLRGDTDFFQTEHLDRWNRSGRVTFVFGYDSTPNLRDRADALPAHAWRKLERPPHFTVQTKPRQRPDKVKEHIVVARNFDNLRLQSPIHLGTTSDPAGRRVHYDSTYTRTETSAAFWRWRRDPFFFFLTPFLFLAVRYSRVPPSNSPRTRMIS